MRPEYIQYLLEIYHHGSISSAAHSLHLSQTTLSSIVRAAENELGFPIFLRAPTGVTVTAEGERLMDLAWELSVRYEELLSLKSREEEHTKPIRVLMSPCINAGLAIPLSKHFYEFDLRGDLTIEELVSTEIGPYIVRKDANIGVTHLAAPALEAFERQQGNTVKTEILYQDYACLLLPPGHSLCQRPAIRVEELKGAHLATVTSFRTVHNRTFLDSLEEACDQVIAFPDLSTMVRAVGEQGMVGVATAYAMQAGAGIRLDDCLAIPFDTDDSSHQMSICLLYRIDRRPRHQERILCACIRDYFREFSSADGGHADNR